jgi:hypothetical protein
VHFWKFASPSQENLEISTRLSTVKKRLKGSTAKYFEKKAIKVFENKKPVVFWKIVSNLNTFITIVHLTIIVNDYKTHNKKEISWTIEKQQYKKRHQKIWRNFWEPKKLMYSNGRQNSLISRYFNIARSWVLPKTWMKNSFTILNYTNFNHISLRILSISKTNYQIVIRSDFCLPCESRLSIHLLDRSSSSTPCEEDS